MHFLGLFAFLPTALAAPFFHAEQAATVIPGQYIIKFKHDEAVVSMSAVKALKKSLSTAPKFEYSLSGFSGFAGTLSDAEFAKLQASEHVEYIQQDVKMHAYGLSYQNTATWGISRISHRHPGNSTYVFDDSAGEGTCAYVIDTGIFVDHPDFKGRATHLANFSDEENNEDGEGHGTHVAGTIGSRKFDLTANSLHRQLLTMSPDTYGVAKKTQLYAVKVLDSYGSGTTSSIIAGIDFITKNSTKHNCPKGRVANMSLGGRKNTATNEAVAAAVASGIFFAVAAGNEGMDANRTSPASEPSVCTVGATSMNDTMTSWSNYGSLVDVLAPGANITSLNNDGGTAMHDGTSMASPHVAGLAAYLLGLEGGSTKGLCEKIAKMGLQGVVRNVRQGTVNTLSNNGALSE